MDWSGVLIGVITFIIIGVFHPIVVKCEYHFTDKVWPVFLAAGLACCIGSLFITQIVLSSGLAVLGFTFLWCIKELKEQKKRVEKGWFPQNPRKILKDEKQKDKAERPKVVL